MNYMLFYTGLASTPNSVGLKNLNTNGVYMHRMRYEYGVYMMLPYVINI